MPKEIISFSMPISFFLSKESDLPPCSSCTGERWYNRKFCKWDILFSQKYKGNGINKTFHFLNTHHVPGAFHKLLLVIDKSGNLPKVSELPTNFAVVVKKRLYVQCIPCMCWTYKQNCSHISYLCSGICGSNPPWSYTSYHHLGTATLSKSFMSLPLPSFFQKHW
jgi:hypothetical protein